MIETLRPSLAMLWATVVAGALAMLMTAPANAVVTIDITRGNVDPLPIAVTLEIFADFLAATGFSLQPAFKGG